MEPAAPLDATGTRRTTGKPSTIRFGDTLSVVVVAYAKAAVHSRRSGAPPMDRPFADLLEVLDRAAAPRLNTASPGYLAFVLGSGLMAGRGLNLPMIAPTAGGTEETGTSQAVRPTPLSQRHGLPLARRHCPCNLWRSGLKPSASSGRRSKRVKTASSKRSSCP
jgi:hypothetical protein